MSSVVVFGVVLVCSVHVMNVVVERFEVVFLFVSRLGL